MSGRSRLMGLTLALRCAPTLARHLVLQENAKANEEGYEVVEGSEHQNPGYQMRLLKRRR